MRSLLLPVVVFFSVLAAAQAPDFSGAWKIDRDLTTANMRWDKTDTLVVNQSGEELRFEYSDRDGRSIGTNAFQPDNLDHPWYKTRMERAWARTHWQQSRLVIESHVNLDLQGYQYYNGYETWELSPDGKMLINRLRDGKAVVYQRVASAAVPQH